jgi:O-antigen ligase
MFSTPWSFAYGIACLVPALLLLLRACDRLRPLVLPAPSWVAALLFTALVVLGSALASPYRGQTLQWSAPLLAGLALVFVLFDQLHANSDTAAAPIRRRQLLTSAGILFLIIAVVSVVLWALQSRGRTGTELFAARNPHPLGHSNYTAGLALLMLPVFGALAFQTRGTLRALWVFSLGLALLMLFTSGSRGGLVGLAVLAFVQLPTLARALRVRLWLVTLVVLLGVTALVAFNPRTRTLIAPRAAGPDLRESTVQRTAMLSAGLALGRERPLLGWGPGATPLAYPRVRALLDGGTENVLQLHSAPVQLWAEFGALGLLAALLLAILAARAAWTDSAVRPVFLGLLGYAFFSFTDWQLDVPIFTAALAAAFALLAPRPRAIHPALRHFLAAFTLLTLALITFLGHADPTPALNLRALALARDPATAPAARALFERSLAANPDQELAHFNLGWLLLTADAAAAAPHFVAAAHLVPDKGGVYFGLGLARLNLGDRPGATRALALECINDPLFLTSPWWRTPALAALRPTVFALTRDLLGTLTFPAADPRSSEAAYVAALTTWIEDGGPPGYLLALAHTTERVHYFVRRPTSAALASAPLRVYRRERTGYPVLMRDTDLATPTDLFDVQENLLAATELNFLFPRKGWLPAPQLLPLLSADFHPPVEVENRK